MFQYRRLEIPLRRVIALSWETGPGSSQETVEDSAEGAQVKMREYRLVEYCAIVLGVGLTLATSGTLAQEPSRRIDVGLAVRYMPTGWFEWSGQPGATSSDLGAYPGLGAAPFVDYRFNRFVSIGFTPELTLNVIPRALDYPISVMLAGSLRLKAEYPGLVSAVPYMLVEPGYSFLFGCCTDGAGSGDAHGFVASAYVGTLFPIGTRHSIFVEVGYMRGFQKDGGREYAPSYLVLAAGWQVSL